MYMRSVIANRAKCRIWSKSCNATIVMHPSIQYFSQLLCYICGDMHARLYFMGLKNLIKARSCFELSSSGIPACLLISEIAKITWLNVWQVMRIIHYFRALNDFKNMLSVIIQNRNTENCIERSSPCDFICSPIIFIVINTDGSISFCIQFLLGFSFNNVHPCQHGRCYSLSEDANYCQ